ncbi:YpzG family protein [Scopulibacillus darangshiensis]|uniref:YpzG family protein n=1 Tax=Scopulibacillus darangshiensis TaxID=442528 RepID=UPI00104B3D66|nr:YpzG family protein [Scopulibacillus darangshiensis]
MGTTKSWEQRFPKYADPFQSPRANPKHAAHQVNGETEKALNAQVLDVLTRKKSLY